MTSARSFVFVSFLVVLSDVCQAQEIWTIGPMFHVGLSGEKKKKSFAIETAYWNLNHFFYSVDFAVEFERGKFRMYSEAQTGIGLTGISLGPVVEFNKGGKTKLGVQGSCWINYFIGFDYRVRYIGKETLHLTGMYFKLPIAASGLDDDGGSSSWGDFDDWD